MVHIPWRLLLLVRCRGSEGLVEYPPQVIFAYMMWECRSVSTGFTLEGLGFAKPYLHPEGGTEPRGRLDRRAERRCDKSHRKHPTLCCISHVVVARTRFGVYV